MNQPQIECLQLACLLIYLVKAWGQESHLTRTAFLWWIAVLLVDIFVWHCDRPAWMQLGINSFDMLLGWLIIYEKYRLPCKRMLLALLALVSDLIK